MTGYGWLKTASGDEVEGQFLGGLAHGTVRHTFSCGDEYVGGMEGGTRQGRGAYAWSDGAVFNGVRGPQH